MLIHPHDSDIYLLELADVESEPRPAIAERHLEALKQVVRWAKEYLWNPHPELGRTGPVCPYIETSMERGLFYLTVRPGTHFVREDLEAELLVYRDWFSQLPPTAGKPAIYKAIQILFPDLDEEGIREVIDGTQERLKPSYVQMGFMIGEFHPLPPQKAGLWNPDFRPLRCPVPMLSIRHMVPTDFAFLRGNAGMMSAYLERHGRAVPPHILPEVTETARRFGLEFPA